ncbi:unnamed protein product [Lactuca virosa]|uniref:Uncharacterized protein n=1 Tax=Lactuca virosa TaxID=75947 RepID=A0AAU9PSS2_9ASTR|nr:unnamed protein product [Lactuca virosa]
MVPFASNSITSDKNEYYPDFIGIFKKMKFVPHRCHQIANHPLLVRRIYTDKDVIRFTKMLHPRGVFGAECILDKVIEEVKGYNDFSIHKLLV